MNAPDLSFAPTAARLGLYPVVDSLAWVVRMLDAGVTTLQLRIKDRPEAVVAADIEAAILLGRTYQARLFINDYWQLAIKLGAYGVHLGQEDLETADLTAIRQAGLRLGLSTHDEAELNRALAYKPSYIALGHIFPTHTKKMPSTPQGLEELRRQVAGLEGIPTVAIGGISQDRVGAVLATGVGSVAVVSAITQAQDWRRATAALLETIEGRRSNDA
ncbi:thiamine phosphate synthase [Biostraticola tofi]|uniref:Thiamine-phosphate synthase n=1 Tax=Biostraticola tofi TaxID=466109 RepID=A0A4V2W3C9_9GAMM|nr:thiamine phosphate synthase [Biostraticola tofi]TCV91489.1 thiamine-phosphate diphosphorylase [Biostraticola tofi]